MKRWDFLPTVLTWVLLGVCIWQVQRIGDAVRNAEPQLAGQSIERGSVTTERYFNEPLDEWVGRHLEAERRFYKP